MNNANKIELIDKKLFLDDKPCHIRDIVMMKVGKTNDEKNKYFLRISLKNGRDIEIISNKTQILKLYENLFKWIKNNAFYGHTFADLKYILINMSQVQDVALHRVEGKKSDLFISFGGSTKIIKNSAEERFEAYKAQHKYHLGYVQDKKEYNRIMSNMHNHVADPFTESQSGIYIL